MITGPTLRLFAGNCTWDSLAPLLDAAADAHAINTPTRVCHWLGQLYVESMGFTRFEENLHYSALRLTQVWPQRFPTLESAKAVAGNPEGLANAVYGGRMGNTAPGDGWTYRGRGLIQITGKAGYGAAAEWSGLDLIGNPQLASQPGPAAQIAAAYFDHHGCNAMADAGDIEGITKAINGGLNALDERQRQTARAFVIWPAGPPTTPVAAADPADQAANDPGLAASAQAVA